MAGRVWKGEGWEGVMRKVFVSPLEHRLPITIRWVIDGSHHLVRYIYIYI